MLTEPVRDWRSSHTRVLAPFRLQTWEFGGDIFGPWTI